MGLETSTEQNWLKEAFREEWPTMGNHLLACGVSISGTAGFCEVAPGFIESDATISALATGLDVSLYFGTLIPQFAYRDRDKLKDETGSYDQTKIIKKCGEYLGLMGVVEAVYLAGRFLGQYYLQKQGWDPATAATTIQVSGSAFFTFALPVLRYAARKFSEKSQ